MTSLNLALLSMVVAALVSILAQRLWIPYTIALVIAGLVAGSSPQPEHRARQDRGEQREIQR